MPLLPRQVPRLARVSLVSGIKHECFNPGNPSAKGLFRLACPALAPLKRSLLNKGGAARGKEEEKNACSTSPTPLISVPMTERPAVTFQFPNCYKGFGFQLVCPSKPRRLFFRPSHQQRLMTSIETTVEWVDLKTRITKSTHHVATGNNTTSSTDVIKRVVRCNAKTPPRRCLHGSINSQMS